MRTPGFRDLPSRATGTAWHCQRAESDIVAQNWYVRTLGFRIFRHAPRRKKHEDAWISRSSFARNWYSLAPPLRMSSIVRGAEMKDSLLRPRDGICLCENANFRRLFRLHSVRKDHKSDNAPKVSRKLRALQHSWGHPDIHGLRQRLGAGEKRDGLYAFSGEYISTGKSIPWASRSPQC